MKRAAFALLALIAACTSTTTKSPDAGTCVTYTVSAPDAGTVHNPGF